MMPATVKGWTALVVPMAGSVAAGIWFFHQSVHAQAVKIENLQTRMTQIEALAAKIDKIADDVSAIREAVAAERGWRQGLMQSLPGAEGETINGLPRGAGG
ncbi:MAG: hypothetical protein V3R71_06400 [Gemmatimonadales bacterium]